MDSSKELNEQELTELDRDEVNYDLVGVTITCGKGVVQYQLNTVRQLVQPKQEVLVRTVAQATIVQLVSMLEVLLVDPEEVTRKGQKEEIVGPGKEQESRFDLEHLLHAHQELLVDQVVPPELGPVPPVQEEQAPSVMKEDVAPLAGGSGANNTTSWKGWSTPQ